MIVTKRPRLVEVRSFSVLLPQSTAEGREWQIIYQFLELLPKNDPCHFNSHFIGQSKSYGQRVGKSIVLPCF